MNPEELRTRTKRFAVSIIRLSQKFKQSPEINIIRNQLLRAGTSVGSNYRAACRARSEKEFFSKISIVIEEADECMYWMEVLAEAELVLMKEMEKDYNESLELLKIFAASRKSISEKMKKKSGLSTGH